MQSLTFILLFLATVTSFGQAEKPDLVIKNENVFDSRTGALTLNQTILIKDGIIIKVTSNQKNYLSAKTIDARRKRLSDTYLPYGVTTVMITGLPEKWLSLIPAWEADPFRYFTAICTPGGALVSSKGHKPSINHVIVDGPSTEKQKVIAFYNPGKGLLNFIGSWEARTFT